MSQDNIELCLGIIGYMILWYTMQMWAFFLYGDEIEDYYNNKIEILIPGVLRKPIKRFIMLISNFEQIYK